MQQIISIPKIPPRKPESHKGDFGRVFVLAGSYGMTGAACLCSKAALRSGAGLVTLGIPESLHGIVATKMTCVMTHPLPETHLKTLSDMGRQDILDFAQRFDIVAIGPGLSQYTETKRLVLWLLQNLERPIVLDADGINALADDVTTLDKIKQPMIITPHPGEMARLLNTSSAKELQSKRFEIAERFIQSRNKVTLVLKGNNTIVMNNEKYYINTTGNPGMATAGSGDVLTGMIAALLGQNFSAFEAAQLGVYLHGMAGDYAKDAVGEISMTASDILDNLSKAFFNHAQEN
ncbi:MAG: NAD(P)H-hydrate dehydratase [Candidatus Kuenenia sp.]|nr:NAD(P)H-hydrate dehydratase [Candidatus Kuenenia hertensis]